MKDKALRDLGDDTGIFIKQADRGFLCGSLRKENYIKEAEKQLQDNSVYKNVNFKEAILSELVEKSNKLLKNLCHQKCITKNELN